MQKRITRIDGEKLEKVAEKLFQQHYIETIYNDYSPICAMVCVDLPESNMVDMEKVRSFAYYGFKVTHIQWQKAGLVFFVYQNPNERGNEL